METTDLPEHPFAPPPINEYGRIDTGSYLKYLTYVYAVVILIVQVVAMPGEVLLRRRFGERYLDPMMVLLGFVGIFVLGAGGIGESDYSVIVFAFVYIVVAILHRLAIFHRDLKGETWHSQSSGLSWSIVTLPAKLAGGIIGRLAPGSLGEGYRERLRAMVVEYVHIFVEPVLISLAAAAFTRLDIGLGIILPLISAAMLVRGVLQYHLDRTRMLDIIDSAICVSPR